MYVGRIVAVGCTAEGRAAGLYRGASRSFPHREAEVLSKGIAIVPKAGFENDIQKNPYIAYNCLRIVRGYAVVTNGSQTDPIAEKLESGMSPRDALAYVSLSMDYEHDSLDTPRISGVVSANGDYGWLSIVRKDALIVRELPLVPGRVFYVCTYERNEPGVVQSGDGFAVATAEQCCSYVLGELPGVFADFEKPVSAACALAADHGTFQTAIK